MLQSDYEEVPLLSSWLPWSTSVHHEDEGNDAILPHAEWDEATTQKKTASKQNILGFCQHSRPWIQLSPKEEGLCFRHPGILLRPATALRSLLSFRVTFSHFDSLRTQTKFSCSLRSLGIAFTVTCNRIAQLVEQAGGRELTQAASRTPSAPVYRCPTTRPLAPGLGPTLPYHRQTFLLLIC